MSTHQAEHLFHGPIAEEYHFLQRICPSAADMSRRVGAFMADWTPRESPPPVQLVELGCGTGITTQCLLASRADLQILAIDNSPTMLNQAREHLAVPLAEGRLELRENEALAALQELVDDSLDGVASAYTLHNFLSGYRSRVLAEIWRVLKPGGVFVNGDRYAIDDPAEHLRQTQEEVRGYFRVFLEMNRPDLLEQWIVHLFSDESPEHLQRLQPALDEMAGLGFDELRVHFRNGVNALVSGVKPWR
jgi:tRNA (cmo5U34)-methyltransferase